MIQTPGQAGVCYPAEDLRRYRWHTGARLRPIASDEPCPILFRDVGPEATARFLRSGLERLAGPWTPLTYLRTWRWAEPYTDHGRIGRLVFLAPLELAPFHSGVEHVYVARASRNCDPTTIGYVPGGRSLEQVAAEAAHMRSTAELREALGGAEYDDAVRWSLENLDRLERELAASERLAAPLRRRLQSARNEDRARAREQMAALGIDEQDLCAAWHHLPAERRAHTLRALGEAER